MCFSAPISFIASAGLTVAGAKSLKISKKEYRLAAAMPLLFGVQQFLEGVQWLLIRSGEASLVVGYAYLFFAFLVWPIYFPLTVYFIEKDKKRKSILKLCIGFGFFQSSFLLFSLMTFPLSIDAAQNLIVYTVDGRFGLLGLIIYAMVIVISPLISTDKYVRRFGIAVFVALLVSWFFFSTAIYSVWCLGAALLTLPIYFYIKKKS